MNNPLIYRGLRSSFRLPKVVLAAVAIGLIVLVAWSYLHMSWQQAQAMRTSTKPLGPEAYDEWVIRPLGLVVLGVQYIIGFALMPAFCLDALPTERLRKSEEFFTTLPTSAVGKTLGLLVGPNVMHLALMGLLTLPVVALLLAGDVSAGPIVWMQILLWSGAVSLSLVGALLGQALGSWRGGWLLVLVLLGVGAALTAPGVDEDMRAFPLLAYAPPALVVRCLAGSEGPPAQQTWFFIWAMPWQLSPLVVHVVVGVSCFAAMAQRLRRPSDPPLPRWATLLVFAAMHVVLVGFLAEDWRGLGGPRGQADIALGAYAGTWFVVLLGWSALRAPRLQAVMEWLSSRGSGWPGRLVSESLTDPRVPGHVATLLAWLMTLGALAVVDAVYLDGIVHWAHAAAAFAALGLFLLGYQSIVLGGSLMARRWGGFLGLVVVVLAVTIPQGFSSLPEVEGDPLIVTPLHPSLAFRTEADMPQFIWPESFATTLIVSACLAALAGGFVLVRLGTLAGRVSRRSAEAGARRG